MYLELKPQTIKLLLIPRDTFICFLLMLIAQHTPYEGGTRQC